MEDLLEDTKSTIVVCLLASQLMTETLDDLKETNFYSGNLKNAIRQVTIQITKNCDKNIAGLWEYDSIESRKRLDSISDIAKILARLDSQSITNLAEELKQRII